MILIKITKICKNKNIIYYWLFIFNNRIGGITCFLYESQKINASRNKAKEENRKGGKQKRETSDIIHNNIRR